MARARDAAVLSATLEDLIARHEALASRGGVQRLRAQLRREGDGAAERALLESAGPGGALAQLRAMRMRVEHWSLTGAREIEDLEPALERLYATGRKRMRRAAKAGKSRRMRALHEWRKRVKDLRYAQEMLGTGKRAKRADALGELLGEEHDLAVLGERVRREAKAGRMGRRSSKQALRAISKRRKKLRKRALRDGKQLYGRKPKAFVRRMRKASTLRSPGRR
jgi:CHAD domain-containing protein